MDDKELKSMYEQLLHEKALKLGYYLAIIVILILPLFYLKDAYMTKYSQDTLIWRSIPIIFGIAFLILKRSKHKENKRVIKYSYLVFVYSILIMMLGLFYMNYGELEGRFNSFLIAGLITTMLVIHVFSAPIRRYISLFTVSTIIFLPFLFIMKGGDLFIISNLLNPLLIITIVWFISINAEKNSYNEFEAKVLLEHNEIALINEVKYRKDITSELAITNQQLELSNLQLEKARQKAEEAVRTKSAFLANMSHEIRTPMNAIIGLSGLTLKTGLDTVQQDYLQKIESAANSLLGIIDDVLDFSKIEADKLKLEQVAFSLDDVMKKLYDLFSLKTESKGLTFEIEVEPGIGRSFVGDPLRLGQVLTNLVANAVKFTETGRIQVRVVEDKTIVLPGKDRVELRFEVIDSGIGIPTDRKEKLFQAFDQVDSSTTRKYGGTGLGLSISKKLVQMMGGTIWVTSELGKGSCFSFTAGFTRVSEKQLAEGDQTDAKHSPESIESALRGAKVLLVEDNDVNQMVAKALLISQGIEVTLATNGKIALDLLQEDSLFDAVLMDIQMPEMDGYTTTRQIRVNDRHKNLPIIAMTAHAMEQEKQKCLEVGMNDHIGKPILPDTLFATLANWISLNKTLDKR